MKQSEIRHLAQRMSLDEIREGLRVLQAELDRRTGKVKFQPEPERWAPHLQTRG